MFHCNALPARHVCFGTASALLQQECCMHHCATIAATSTLSKTVHTGHTTRIKSTSLHSLCKTLKAARWKLDNHNWQRGVAAPAASRPHTSPSSTPAACCCSCLAPRTHLGKHRPKVHPSVGTAVPQPCDQVGCMVECRLQGTAAAAYECLPCCLSPLLVWQCVQGSPHIQQPYNVAQLQQQHNMR